MVSETEIVNLLKRAKAKFEARAKEDIVNALRNFKDLVPEVRKHQFPDGMERTCFALQGTIAITYKGSTYHIPVALYFADNHPYSGPFCFVTPTASMRIRTSQQVDDKGRIYLPYLTEWQYPSHNTAELLQVLTMIFQEKCPVFSVSSSSAKPSPNTSSGQAPYPATNPTPYPSVSSTPYPTVPNPAPYPTTTPHMPMPSSYGGPQANASPYATGGGYQPPYQPYVNVPPASAAPTIGSGAVGSGYSFGTIQPSHIRASLISAIEERVRQCLRDKLGTPYAELQSVSITLQELRSGQQKLREMSDSMDREQKELDNILTTYKEKKLELEKALEAYAGSQAENGDGSDVDHAIDASAPLHRQILRCYVEDSVVDDTIYFLGQALKKGSIDLQTYLKHVRQLSRKQFAARATMQKCRQTAKLPV